MSFRLSSGAIERSVNADEDRGRLTRRATADRTRSSSTSRATSPARTRAASSRRLGARVVRVEPPDGDPMRPTATAWDTALRAGSESVVCDLPADAAFARALCARADVVLEGFRPGVAARLGIGPDDVPPRRSTARSRASVTCPAPRARRPRPQLPRLGRRPRGHGARRFRRSRSPTSRRARSEP